MSIETVSVNEKYGEKEDVTGWSDGKKKMY